VFSKVETGKQGTGHSIWVASLLTAAKKFADIETKQLFAAGECGPSCKETKTLQNRTGLKHGYHSSNLLNALYNMGSWV